MEGLIGKCLIKIATVSPLLRNRAINEDCVVVELLPRSKWKGKSKLLPTGHSSESHDQSYDSLVMPTGKIVGIMERASRDIVASFPVSCMGKKTLV